MDNQISIITQCKLVDSDFDYNYVKNKYWKLIKVLIKKQKVKWRKGSLAGMINRIKMARRLKDKEITAMLRRQMLKYDVAKRDGKDILIMKRKNSKEKMIEIVALEDAFDIIAKTHLDYGHCKKTSMRHKLNTAYIIPKICFDALVKSCNVCVKQNINRIKTSRLKRVFSRDVCVRVIFMDECTDTSYHYVLAYIDSLTKFVILRPLESYDVDEVAIELIKIFSDFGFPLKLDTSNVQFFHEVIKIIKNLWPDFSVSVIEGKTETPVSVEEIKSSLCRWIAEIHCTNWVIGCHMVQWILNTKNVHNGETPYKSVFGGEPKCKLAFFHRAQTVLIEPAIGTSNSPEVSNNDISDNVDKLTIKNDLDFEEDTLIQKLAEKQKQTDTSAIEISDDSSELITESISTNKDIAIDSGSDLCHICKYAIVKPYNCYVCKKSVHRTCLSNYNETVELKCLYCAAVKDEIDAVHKEVDKTSDNQVDVLQDEITKVVANISNSY